LQEDKKEFEMMYSNVIRLFTVFGGIISLVLFIYAKEFLFILYGEKWVNADFYMKILALASFFYMQEMFNRILFKVFNQTHKILVLEIIKKTINFITLVFGIYFQSIEVLMYGYLFTAIVSYFINYYVSRGVYLSEVTNRELNYALKVIFVMIIIIFTFYLINREWPVRLMYNLLYLPFIVGFYLFFLNGLKVIDFKKDIEIIKEIRR